MTREELRSMKDSDRVSTLESCQVGELSMYGIVAVLFEVAVELWSHGGYGCKTTS